MDFVPHTEEETKEMLKVVGAANINELFKELPQKQLLKENLKIPEKLSEMELTKFMKCLSSKNKVTLSFLGAGSYNHFVPSVVDHIISRSEFYTAYTPYQPEISQGILQAIFEYQTMIAELTGTDLSNASMYDGSSALAEAMIMATSATGKNKILISKAINPEYRAVVKTYAWANNKELVELPFEDGITSADKIKKNIDDDTAAVMIQSPNFFGCIEDLEEIKKACGEVILVAAVGDATSLGLLKKPGDFADIVVGEGQSFGNPMSYGGPYLGFMATKEKYMRLLPGRIVGKTVDADGKRGFILTLQAREQHIRRAKATSNICSNEALCALAATVHLSMLGKNLKKVADLNLQKAHYAFDALKKAGCEPIFKSHFYNEFVVKVKDSKSLQKDLLKHDIVAGLNLEKYYPELKNCMLFCVTEMHSKKDIGKLVELIK